jgi:hypothetical protein
MRNQRGPSGLDQRGPSSLEQRGCLEQVLPREEPQSCLLHSLFPADFSWNAAAAHGLMHRARAEVLEHITAVSHAPYLPLSFPLLPASHLTVFVCSALPLPLPCPYPYPCPCPACCHPCCCAPACTNAPACGVASSGMLLAQRAQVAHGTDEEGQ